MQGLQQIIVGIDFSESSRTALAQAVRLGAQTGADVRAIHVVEKASLDHVVSSLEQPAADTESRVLSHARFAIERMVAEVAATGKVRVDVSIGPAAAELLRAADAAAASSTGDTLLVMGSAGQDHPSRSVGSTAGRCIRHGKADVLLVRTGNTGPFKRIVVGVDFSDTSRHALHEAVRIAQQDGSRVDALHVFMPPPPAYPVVDGMGLWPLPLPNDVEFTTRLRETAEGKLLDTTLAVTKELAGGGNVQINPVVVLGGGYGPGVCEYARENNADLVVVGTHGRTNLRYLLLGSTAEKVLHEAPCSVLAVKPYPEEKAS